MYCGYKLITRLGQGAFASVYLAEHIETFKRYAVKIIEINQ